MKTLTLIITLSTPLFSPNRLMTNVSQKEGTAKQLLPTVLEEKSATEFTALSPVVLNAQCDQWDKEIKKQTNNSVLRPAVLIPISESKGKNPAGTF